MGVIGIIANSVTIVVLKRLISVDIEASASQIIESSRRRLDFESDDMENFLAWPKGLTFTAKTLFFSENYFYNAGSENWKIEQNKAPLPSSVDHNTTPTWLKQNIF